MLAIGRVGREPQRVLMAHMLVIIIIGFNPAGSRHTNDLVTSDMITRRVAEHLQHRDIDP
jgi:hypothetical protein